MRTRIVAITVVLGACTSAPAGPAASGSESAADASESAAGATEESSAGDATSEESSAEAPGTEESSAEGTGSETGTDSDQPVDPDVPASAWTPGEAPLVLPGESLWPLPPGLAGAPLWISNNPERFTGTGWLQQHARVDPQRGGEALPLDHAAAYIFHLNGSGAARTVHLVATNPQQEPVAIDAWGLVTTNQQHPIGQNSGPSVAVAAAWLSGELPTLADSLMIEPAGGVVLSSTALPANAMLDGRVEFEATAGIYLYSVVTTNNDPIAAINATQGAPAPGDIATPGPNAYGRNAGVYAHSEWISEVTVEVPPPPAHTGLMLNTADKFAYGGVTLQDQTAPALMHLSDSSDKSYGNYGMRYDLLVRLCATPGATEVRVAFAHHVVGDVDTPSFTYNGDARVGAETVAIYTTPTQPRQVLIDLALPAEGCTELPLELYVPGLITIGHQLSFESR